MCSPAIRIQEERVMHEAKLAKMEAEMKMVFQQKVQEKEAKLKQSEEELYARHREMKDALEKQRLELEEKKRRAEGGRPLTPEKTTVSLHYYPGIHHVTHCIPTTDKEEGLPSCLILDSVHGQLDVPFFPFCLILIYRLPCSIPLMLRYSLSIVRGVVSDRLLMITFHPEHSPHSFARIPDRFPPFTFRTACFVSALVEFL